MAELLDSELELLEQYEAGTLSPQARVAFEAELSRRPELRAALDGARAVEKALPALAEPSVTEQRAQKWIQKSLPAPGASRARTLVLLAAAAALLAFGWWRFGFDELESLSGTVRVDGKTLVAGESITSPDEVITGESGLAHVRRRRSTWLIPAGSQVGLRANTIEHGAVVVQGEARLWINGTAVEIAGESVVAVEPIEGAFRETSHLEPGDLMNGKTLRVGGVALGAAALTVYVLSGSAWITPSDEMTVVQVDAGSTWSATASRTVMRTSRPSPDSIPFEGAARPELRAVPGGIDASVQIGQAPVGFGAAGTNGATGGPTVVAPAKRYALNVDGIRGAIQSTLPDIEECYSSWLQQQPNLSGRMVIGFRIGPNDAGAGSVQELSVVDGGLGHALMEGCVMNAVQDLAFDEPEEPLTVNYPFLFSSGADGGS